MVVVVKRDGGTPQRCQPVRGVVCTPRWHGCRVVKPTYEWLELGGDDSWAVVLDARRDASNEWSLSI